MQGVLAAAKFQTGSALSRAAVQASSSRAAAFGLGSGQPLKKAPSPPATRSHATPLVAASAAVAEPPAQQAAVPLTPPARKVRKSINDAKFIVKFIMPDSLVGCFLGRGGANVNRIKEETGVYIQFTKPGTAVNSESERLLILAADSVEDAKQAFGLLMEAVAQVEGALLRLRTRESGERLFFQQVIPAMCAGNIMGPAGETIKGIAARTGTSMLVEPKIPNAAFIPFRVVDYVASDHLSLAAAVGDVMDRLALDEKYFEGIREVRSVCVRIIKVPHMRVGAILGPGGAHVKAVQEMLKVKIGVSETAIPHPTLRYVTLWGDPLNVKVAINMVMLATGQLQAEMERRLSDAYSSTAQTDDESESEAGSEASSLRRQRQQQQQQPAQPVAAAAAGEQQQPTAAGATQQRRSRRRGRGGAGRSASQAPPTEQLGQAAAAAGSVNGAAPAAALSN